MRSRTDFSCERGDVVWTSNLIESAIGNQLLVDSEDVDRLLFERKAAYCLKDKLVLALIESLDSQNLADLAESVFLEHDSAKHSFLDFNRLWLYFTQNR